MLLTHGPFPEIGPGPRAAGTSESSYHDAIMSSYRDRMMWRYAYHQLTGHHFEVPQEVQWDRWWAQERERHEQSK